MNTEPRTSTTNGEAMIRAILRKPISASPARAFHSADVDGAACRHFRRHSRCASFLRRANRTATPSMRKMYVSDCIRASTSSNRHPVVRGDLTDRCAKHHAGAVSLNNPLPERSMRLRLLALSSVVMVVCCTPESPRTVAVSADSSRVRFYQEKRPEGFQVGRAFQAQQSLDVTVGDIPEDVSTIPPATSANILIRTATASIEVDSLER